MPLKINSTGGGSVTIDAGSIASNRTLTMPDASGIPVLSDSSGNVNITGVLSALLTSSLATSGYVKLPNGLYIQWGLSGTIGDGTLTFPIAFPNTVYTWTGTSSANGWIIINGLSNTGVGIIQRTNISGYAATSGSIGWVAIGR